MIKRLLTALWGAGLALGCLAPRAGAPPGLGVSLEVERGLLAKLQTAYIFNIARFVTWPHDDGVVRLCLPAESPLARYARELDGHDVGEERKLSLAVGPLDLAHCDIAFVRVAEAVPPALGAGSAPARTLLISDRPDALARGFAMQLFVEADTVRFAVNGEIVSRAEYRASSKLLRLARPAP